MSTTSVDPIGWSQMQHRHQRRLERIGDGVVAFRGGFSYVTITSSLKRPDTPYVIREGGAVVNRCQTLEDAYEVARGVHANGRKLDRHFPRLLVSTWVVGTASYANLVLWGILSLFLEDDTELALYAFLTAAIIAAPLALSAYFIGKKQVAKRTASLSAYQQGLY